MSINSLFLLSGGVTPSDSKVSATLCASEQPNNEPSPIVVCALAVLGSIGILGAIYAYGRFSSSAPKLPWLQLAWEGEFDTSHTGKGRKLSPFGGIWTGTFLNGKLNGFGRIEEGLSGLVEEGFYEHDVLVEGVRIKKHEKKIEAVSKNFEVNEIDGEPIAFIILNDNQYI